MGATIHYRLKRPEKTLEVALPSSFMANAKKVFGFCGSSMTFGREDLERVRVLAAVNENESGWEQLAKLIEEHGDVEIWAGY